MILFFLLLLTPKITWSQEPPQGILLPPSLETRSSLQIKSIVSSLQNTYQNEKGVVWWLKMQQAFLLKEKEESFFCKNMKELSEDLNFPLHQLTLIYFYENCPLPEIPPFDLSVFPEWLHAKASKSFYTRYTKFKNKKQLLEATLTLIKQTGGRELKISYIKQAIDLAKKLEDPRLKDLKAQFIRFNPELKPNPTYEDYIPIARNYKRKRKFKKAIYFYKKALNSPLSSFHDKNTCFKSLKQIYKLQKRYDRYFLASKQWSSWLQNQKEKEAQKIKYRNQISLARHYWNVHKDQKALAILEALLEESLSDTIRGEVHWLKGIIKIKSKTHAIHEGLKELSTSISFLKKSKKKQELLERVIWNKAWFLRSEQRFQEAVDGFNELEDLTKNPYVKSRVLFWKGRTLGELKKEKEKEDTFNKLIKEEPYSYYGLLATRSIKKKLNIHTSKEDSIIKNVHLDQKSLLIILWLSSFDETKILKSFLKFKKKLIIRKRKKSLKDWKSFLSMQALAKQYLNIFFTFRILKKNHQNYFWKNHIDLLFPLEFKEEITLVSKKWDVPSALIFALIRQESAFNPKARSPADAFGLMQIIPSTARSIAVQIKTPYKETSDLYDPLKNITLGTFYIKKLLKRYNNSLILSLAAYNAGGTPVKDWKNSADNIEPLEFIENIPYEETRTYVKLLIRNFIIYNAILDEDSSPFPQWIFEIEKSRYK